MKPKVLFVDDEPQVLETLSQLFEADYDVYTALGGEAALAVLEQQPDLAVVVSDQRMPGIKGVEVLAAARQRVPNATRILLTGFADADAAMDSVNMGEVFRYIKKPWKTSELEEVMRLAVAAHYSLSAQQAHAQVAKSDNLKKQMTTSLPAETHAALQALAQKVAGKQSQVHEDTIPSLYLSDEVMMHLKRQQLIEEEFFERLNQKVEESQSKNYESAFCGQGGKPKLLVVDDEPSVLEALTELFREEYDVICKTSAVEALQLLEKDAFVALILTDQRMPGKTGANLLIESRRYAPLVPKILITAYTDVEDIVQLINEGQIYRYIQKPWNPEKLKETVRDAVRTYMLQLSMSLKSSSKSIEHIEQSKSTPTKSNAPALQTLQALHNLQQQQKKKDSEK
jgi:response regulator RpfG family c-di-GMP phosphodiesterase